jgi:Ice-binding-like
MELPCESFLEDCMKFRSICLLLLLALGSNAYAQAPNLKTAGTFGVLAGSGVISPDAGTTVVGNVGSAPTPTVTGLLAAQVTGTLYTAANAATTQAQTDLTAAYLDAAGRTGCIPLTGALGTGLNANLTPGVYCYSSSALLNGTLTLTGNSTDVWIFQIGSTLTTATGASVAFAGGASPCNVFWQIGTSATIQTGNNFAGTIMALTSITLNGGTLNGRALARNGSVTISSKEGIFSGCSGASTVSLSPATSSVICGAGASITETAVVFSSGNPVVGTPVLFTITGPDSGHSGTVSTDGSGTATLTIVPTSITSSSGDTFVASISGGTITSNTTIASCTAQGTPPFPSVTLLTTNPGPPKQVILSVRALGGLFSVVVNTPPTTNATISIPAFDRGSTQALGVTATKINQAASAVVELTVTDLLGHMTVFDPVFATITIPAFKSNHARKFDFNHREKARYDGIGQTEGKVLLQNDAHGVDFLVIRVNGSEFKTHLSGGETKSIDISSALFHGTNTVSVAAFGKPGGSVDLTISDGN